MIELANTEIELKEIEKNQLNSGPVKFVMWVFIVSIVMMFAGLTSGYIVRKAEGNWVQFNLPSMFWYTTAAILLSSLALYWASRAAKRQNSGTQKAGLWIALILGIFFVIGQYIAWKQLVAQGIYLTGNPSGSFLYIISGLHALHIIAGLFFLLAGLIGAYKGISQPKNMLRMELASIFWHFVDILWIYLFVFLLLNQ